MSITEFDPFAGVWVHFDRFNGHPAIGEGFTETEAADNALKAALAGIRARSLRKAAPRPGVDLDADDIADAPTGETGLPSRHRGAGEIPTWTFVLVLVLLWLAVDSMSYHDEIFTHCLSWLELSRRDQGFDLPPHCEGFSGINWSSTDTLTPHPQLQE